MSQHDFIKWVFYNLSQNTDKGRLPTIPKVLLVFPFCQIHSKSLATLMILTRWIKNMKTMRFFNRFLSDIELMMYILSVKLSEFINVFWGLEWIIIILSFLLFLLCMCIYIDKIYQSESAIISSVRIGVSVKKNRVWQWVTEIHEYMKN